MTPGESAHSQPPPATPSCSQRSFDIRFALIVASSLIRNSPHPKKVLTPSPDASFSLNFDRPPSSLTSSKSSAHDPGRSSDAVKGLDGLVTGRHGTRLTPEERARSQPRRFAPSPDALAPSPDALQLVRPPASLTASTSSAHDPGPALPV